MYLFILIVQKRVTKWLLLMSHLSLLFLSVAKQNIYLHSRNVCYLSALKYIKGRKKKWQDSDSKSELSSGSQDPFITTTLVILSSIHAESNKVIFCWVPSHVCIAGNEQADSAAKAALSGRMSHNPIPHTDFKFDINKYDLWQGCWNEAYENKLQPFKPIIGNTSPTFFWWRGKIPLFIYHVNVPILLSIFC